MRPDITRPHSTGPATGAFDRFDLRPELLRAIADAAYAAPRPVQELAMPPALAGRDVLGLAQTGTGKTAAFALPILQHLLGARRPGPRALIVAPTRELAAQVHGEIVRLGRHTPVTSISLFGGVPIARQVSALRQKPDVVVACPGRLLDLLERRALRLDGVEILVLDEADHMFDMGFLPDLKRILRALPARRQNLMYSATMPREIRRLADEVLKNPAVIELSHSRPAETIDHALYLVGEGEKVAALERLLGSDSFTSAIVFLRTKRRAKRLAERLDSRGHAAVAMQGNMSQPQRERALRGFREGGYDVLVATDIAARGLDIAGVSHVVNFDVPNTPDAYTHRIGRTGRSEQTGSAFTFVTPADGEALRAIEKRLGAPITRRPLSELGHLESSSLAGSKRGGGQRGGGPRAGAPSPHRSQRSGSGPRKFAADAPSADTGGRGRRGARTRRPAAIGASDGGASNGGTSHGVAPNGRSRGSSASRPGRGARGGVDANPSGGRGGRGGARPAQRPVAQPDRARPAANGNGGGQRSTPSSSFGSGVFDGGA